MSRLPKKVDACCSALVLASLLVWSSSPWAQGEIQNAPSVRYFGQPVERTHPVEYQLAISPKEMAALLKQDSAQGKANADKDDATLLDADQRSAIESTVGTWFQGGHTGAWYNSAQDGHGLFLEVLSDPSTTTGMQVFAAW